MTELRIKEFITNVGKQRFNDNQVWLDYQRKKKEKERKEEVVVWITTSYLNYWMSLMSL